MEYIPIVKEIIKVSPILPSFDTMPSVRTSRERLKDALNAPEIKSLCGNIWMSGELHLLFADTGVGKSILAVTIANALSKGEKVLFLENQCPPLKVLYYDFELSDRQFLQRYSENNIHYNFSDNLLIDTIDFAEIMKFDSEPFEEVLFKKIRFDIEKHKVKVLVIDNITYLNTQTTQKTDTALNVMRQLIELKKQYEISILVLAHTPKINPYEPITINSLAGSKHLSNFSDGVSSIGKSNLDSNLRYIKQVKPSRSAEIQFDTNNVITASISKLSNFLTFDFIEFSNEAKHLKPKPADENNRDDLIKKAKEMQAQGKSMADIAEELYGKRTLKGTVSKLLNTQKSIT